MANRFWVTQPVSGAVVSVASPPQIRLTVSSTTGMTTGDVRTVFNVGGTTEANGTWTITVIDATHIDLQGTTFTNLYTSGGSVNGKWDGTNTNNWVTTSGGSNYGQTIPGSADVITLDGSAGGGTVTVNVNITAQSLACGAFTGTLDFSANNNNVTLSGNAGFNGSGTGTRTINLGNGIWTISTATGNNTCWNLTTTTGLTFNANSSTIDFTGVMAAGSGQTMQTGAQTYSTVKISGARLSSGLAITGGGTIATLNIAAAATVSFGTTMTVTTLTQSAQCALIVITGTTLTITNAPALVGTAAAPLSILNSSNVVTATTATISTASGAFSGTWCSIYNVTFSGGATFSFTNSEDLGRNSGATITAPSAGSGGGSVFGAVGGVIA